MCAELLKRGSFADALRYMERCEQVTKLICSKLRPAAARQGLTRGLHSYPFQLNLTVLSAT